MIYGSKQIPMQIRVVERRPGIIATPVIVVLQNDDKDGLYFVHLRKQRHRREQQHAEQAEVQFFDFAIGSKALDKIGVSHPCISSL